MPSPAAARVIDDPHRHHSSADLVVVGATPGGIAAACSAAEEGLAVVLLASGRHLGGHLASGVCTTEIEHMLPESFSGWMVRFLRRVGRHYGIDGPLHRWEPHVAEAVFGELLLENQVAVLLDVGLKQVDVDGGRIRSVLLADGRRIGGSAFIDASYEGDLFALAGVPYRVGRESRDEYGESLAGMRFIDDVAEVRNSKGHAHKIDTCWSLDLRRADGMWIEGVTPGVEFRPGAGDAKVMNYHFRVTVTKAATRIPFGPPPGYREERFELLARYFRQYPEATMRRILGFIDNPSGSYALDASGSTVVKPGDKWELNNHQASVLSLGHLGGQFDYPEADANRRSAIIADHYDYNAGLLHFLSCSREVPAHVREAMQQWGLPPDEYVDHGHWPYQLYVREARRMRGQFVVTQRDLLDEIQKPDAIMWNSHWIDCHHVQRLALDAGHFRNEGRIWREITRPYAIPFRALVPPTESVQNLLVCGGVSASHVAFSSIRLESTWMGLGEAAGCGVALALASNRPCQTLDVSRLQHTLRRRGVYLP
jgi:hypothetical protein